MFSKPCTCSHCTYAPAQSTHAHMFTCIMFSRAVTQHVCLATCSNNSCQHIPFAQVQLQACYALWSLVTRCVPNQIEACKKNAVEATVASMRAHPSSAPLQDYGCRVLGNLSLSGQACQESVARGNGVEAILCALQNHLGNVEVQGAGCLALGFIAAANEETKSIIAEKGGVEAVATSGQRHQDSIEVRRVYYRYIYMCVCNTYTYIYTCTYSVEVRALRRDISPWSLDICIFLCICVYVYIHGCTCACIWYSCTSARIPYTDKYSCTHQQTFTHHHTCAGKPWGWE